jgi:hypothetical protein
MDSIVLFKKKQKYNLIIIGHMMSHEYFSHVVL